MTEYVADRLIVATRNYLTVYDKDRNLVEPAPPISMSTGVTGGSFVEINKEGTIFAVRNSTGRAFLYDNEGAILPQFPTGVAGVDARGCAFSDDGTMFARASDEYQDAVAVHDMATGALLWKPTVGHGLYNAYAYDCAFHPSGAFMAVSAFVYSFEGVHTGGAVVILETNTWSVVTYFPASANGFPDYKQAYLEFSPDGAYLAGALLSGSTGDFLVVRTSDWSEVAIDTEVGGEPTTRTCWIAFSNDGTKLAVARNSAAGNNTISPVVVLGVGGGWPILATSATVPSAAFIVGLDFSPDDSTLAMAVNISTNPSLYWFNASDLSVIEAIVLPTYTYHGRGVAFGPAGIPPVPTVFWTDLKGSVEVP